MNRHALLWWIGAVVCVTLVACTSEVDSSGEDGGGAGTATSNAPAVDLLLVIDNSRSMADKQQILAAGVPELLAMFTNPRCLGPNGSPASDQPATPTDPCPPGSQRQFAPVTNMHIGIISSSIGGHGADACQPDTIPGLDDHAHLLDRSGTSPAEPPVPSYQGLGFLAWDPGGRLQPPGEGDVGALIGNLQAMVAGVGELGCGFEAQLESWYRFLVDPNPYASISVSNSTASLDGTDQVLLDQRTSFMRPDSVLVILMITDENDCSTRDGSQFFYVNQIYQPGTNQPYRMPKPRAACATDPASSCCRSCAQAGDGCDTSQDDCSSGPLAAQDDPINLRCFDQKRRFGIDFLWPIDRYAIGLTATEVADRDGNVLPNPLFLGGRRNPAMVYLGALVGVPWQDIARRNAGGAPDLLAGLKGGQPIGGLQDASELVQNGTWNVIVGDPNAWLPAADPLMVESIDPRGGANPITGDAISPPGAGYLANPINGHEYSMPSRDDLQYACIFPLAQPRDCTDPNQIACDCANPGNDSPLCQAPDGQFGTTQYFAKAYPGLRELQLLSLLGPQAAVGSACPAQTTAADALDWGYRPSLAALVDAVARSLAQ